VHPKPKTWLTAHVHLPADTSHAFTLKENDWGFNQYMPQRQLTASEGFVVNDTLVLEVLIRLDRFESFNYNSKKETGHVGLKNQGATCYMNSLLQTLYNLNHFRKVPTSPCYYGALPKY